MRRSTRLLIASSVALVGAIVTYAGCAVVAAPALNLFRFEQRGVDILAFIIPPLVVATLLFGLTLIVLGCLSNPPGNQCAKCEYDLTGNVSGVCPECGTPIDKG